MIRALVFSLAAGAAGAGMWGVAEPARADPCGSGYGSYPKCDDSPSYCEIVRTFTPQVVEATTPLQAATSRKGWKWTDPEVQAATARVDTDYTNLYRMVGVMARPFVVLMGPHGDYRGDGANLESAMHDLQSTVDNADTPSDVPTGTKAVLDAVDALRSDCVGAL